MTKWNNKAGVTPVFALYGAQPSSPLGYVRFDRQEIGGPDDVDARRHGYFDPATGLFNVRTQGVYQMHFIGHLVGSIIGVNVDTARVRLQVNGHDKAVGDTSNWGPLVVSALVRLKQGDRVGVLKDDGGGVLKRAEATTQFIGVLLSSSG